MKLTRTRQTKEQRPENKNKNNQSSENKNREKIERQERHAAREKYRKDTEIYGDIFYDWETIMKEKETRLRQEEKERNTRINKIKDTTTQCIGTKHKKVLVNMTSTLKL